MFRAMNKNKMKQDNRLYKIEIREVDKGKKRIKIHYKSLSEDTDEWRDYCSLFDLEGFHCLHLLYLNFIIVNFESIFRSSFPSVQQLCL